MNMNHVGRRVALTLGLLALVPALAAAAPRPPQSRDHCIVNRSI